MVQDAGDATTRRLVESVSVPASDQKADYYQPAVDVPEKDYKASYQPGGEVDHA
jgi:hypothetical protein